MGNNRGPFDQGDIFISHLMIIWTGRGILMPIMAGAAAVAGAVLGSKVESWLGISGGSLSIPLGAGSAAAGLWVFALTALGRTQEQVLIDPQTQQNVRIRRSHTLYFIPPIAWAVIGSIGAVVFTFVGFVAESDNRRQAEAERQTPGLAEAHRAFDAADDSVGSYKGSEAFGNTPVSRNAASGFAKSLKKLRDIGFEETKSSKLSTSKGHFLTHCQLSGDTCFFLVHVPDLRKFADDAKDSIADLAWMVAGMEAGKLDPKPAKLAVAIRGFALYDRLLTGPLVGKGPDDTAEPARSIASPQKELMYKFFMPSRTPPAKASTAAAPNAASSPGNATRKDL